MLSVGHLLCYDIPPMLTQDKGQGHHGIFESADIL